LEQEHQGKIEIKILNNINNKYSYGIAPKLSQTL